MNIICVIVTFNRLNLLKECINSVLSQTYPVKQIIIIDNHSTDGTPLFLSNFNSDKRFKIISMKENVGGAGGFSEGIKQASLAHADWIWLMDDDTIPQNDTLEKMIPYTQIDHVGYVCSKVIWTNGEPHLMNRANLLEDQSTKKILSENYHLNQEEWELSDMASFVSLLVKGRVPWELGLPYKEFFIWCDDAEYTQRIANNGYYGIYAKTSIALHKTEENYVSSLYTAPASMAWKIYYGVRNDSFIRRKRKGWLKFIFAQLNCFRTHFHHIKKRHLPQEDERKLLKANNKGLWAGFTFNPKVEFLTEKGNNS